MSSGMLRCVAPVVTANDFLFSDYFHLEDGGDTFLRNVGSYKSHTASHH
jgi:hypothetical protein